MRNNFKLRFVLILFVVSSIFLLGNFVSAATYDATGDWFISISEGWTDGGDNCPIEIDQTVPVTIIQNGDSFSLVVGDETFAGSVTDNNYSITTYFNEDEDNEVTVSGGFTLSSSTSGTGQMEISVTEGDISCDKGMDIALTKQGAVPIHDLDGEWSFSTSNTWAEGGPNCTADIPDTGIITVTQTGNNVTVVTHELGGGITYTGSVSGSIYSFTVSFPEDDGTMTINIIYTPICSYSGTGKASYTWTNGIETCIGGFDISISFYGYGGPTGGPDTGCFISSVFL
jgi:hypothetical protein